MFELTVCRDVVENHGPSHCLKDAMCAVGNYACLIETIAFCHWHQCLTTTRDQNGQLKRSMLIDVDTVTQGPSPPQFIKAVHPLVSRVLLLSVRADMPS